MKKKRMLQTMMVFALAFSLLGGVLYPAMSQAAEWKFFTYFPSNDRVVKEYRNMVTDIYSATGEKLKLNLYVAGELPYKPVDGIKITNINYSIYGKYIV